MLYRQRKIVHDQDHRYRTCNYTTRTMTQGPGTSASNDFRPFKNYTDLKDTLKTLKRHRNEVSYTINIENVWYINSCSANRSILGGFSSLFWEEILSKIFEWNSKIYFSDKHLTDLIAHVWYNFVKSLLHSLPLIKLLDKTIYRVREAFIQT